ncbi:MAG: flagellar biosynthesis protein FlgD, partial [Candidatus Eisenbacteria bacterium]|nr:flagellar biosynthesis protein FlgD [Candidatus Eisenbacteria bacterium]
TAAILVTIHDVMGRTVRTISPGESDASGAPAFTWDGKDDAGRDLGAGTYWVRVTSTTGEWSRPLIRLR